MTFAPGASGNPRGRPKKRWTFAELFDREMARPFSDQQSRKERIVEVAVDQACAGDLDALKWIADRTEGKVKDVHDLKVSGAVQLVPWGPKRDTPSGAE